MDPRIFIYPSLYMALTVLVDLADDLAQVALGHLDAHHPQDGGDGVHVDGALLVRVEGIEGLAQT